MKKLICLICVITFYFFSPCRIFGALSETESKLPLQLQIFCESSRWLMSGINNKCKEDLINASEGFANLSRYELYDSEINFVEGYGDLDEPVVQFCEDYCDEILRNNFELIKMDNLATQRESNAWMRTLTQDILPGGKVMIQFWGAEDVSVVIAQAIPSALNCCISTDDNSIELTSDSSGHVLSGIYDLGEAKRPYMVEISNPTDRNVSFTLAVN